MAAEKEAWLAGNFGNGNRVPRTLVSIREGGSLGSALTYGSLLPM